MATKIKKILDLVPRDSLLFSSWMASQGLDRKEQTLYVRSGWLERMAQGVYKIAGSTPTLYVVASFNEHSSYALSVLCEAIGLHETNNTVSPEPFVHVDAVLRITVLLEENEASFH